MSRRVLLANFLVMVVLSLVAGGLVAFPPAPPPTPEPLLPAFDASRVVAIQRGREGGPTEQGLVRLSRDAAGAWTLRAGPGPSAVAWPVADVRVRNALRMLAEATLTPSRSADVPTDATPIIVQHAGSTQILFGNASAAGRIPVVVQDADRRRGLTDDRLAAVLSYDGLLAWRDDRAMPGVARDPTRVRIAVAAAGGASPGGIELSRVQGRWGLIGGVVDRADAGAVQASVDALARVTISQFRDNLDPASAGLADPRVTMHVQGGRGPDAYTWQIQIGGPASADGSSVFAALTGQRGEGDGALILGPVYGVVSLDALSKVYANPEPYLARTALETLAPDVRRFSIRTADASRVWAYERTIDGWRITSPGADASRAATSAEAAAIPAMLETLCTTRATAVGMGTPDGFTPIATLSVEGAGGLASESITIGRAPAPGATAGAPTTSVLAVVGPTSWRTYGPMPEAMLALLPVVP